MALANVSAEARTQRLWRNTCHSSEIISGLNRSLSASKDPDADRVTFANAGTEFLDYDHEDAVKARALLRLRFYAITFNWVRRLRRGARPKSWSSMAGECLPRHAASLFDF